MGENSPNLVTLLRADFLPSFFVAILSDRCLHESKHELARYGFCFMLGASHHHKDDVGCTNTPL
jgi:hypothetical protein